jgi:hypothetical protein
VAELEHVSDLRLAENMDDAEIVPSPAVDANGDPMTSTFNR